MSVLDLIPRCPNCNTPLMKVEGLLGLKGVWECPECLKKGDRQCRFDNSEIVIQKEVEGL